MGEVYRARDTNLGRDVAIKVLPDAVAQDSERLARFQREAKVLAALNHPNIGHIYGLESGALVMELIEGGTIKDPLPVETALAYARQIAAALEAAHDKGIVHRDLKPANIMVTPDGVVKVLDFGLAKAAGPTSGTIDPANSPTETISQTRSGVILGTAAYMSPEQARGAIADARADVWAFGVVLYEMLAGKRAFSGESVTDILATVLRGDPDWSALPNETPPRIHQLLRRCLERDRKQRLQAIGEARIAIDAKDDEVPPAPARARAWPWIDAVLSMALAILACTWWWQTNRSVPLKPLMRLDVQLPADPKPERPDGGGFFALSPDGTQLAMTVRSADGRLRLATRRFDQTPMTTLAGTEGANSPTFSPDGQWIAFAADRKIKKISVAGGAVVTVCDSNVRYTASWGDDGNLIATLGFGSGLSKIPAAGGTPKTITEPNREKGELWHRWPQVLPGSRAVLFSVQHSGQSFDEDDIEVLSFETGQRKTLRHGGFFPRYLPSGHLIWVHQNVLFAAPFDLRRLTLTGEPQPVVEDIRSAEQIGADFAFSRAGLFVYGSGAGEMLQAIFWLDRSGKTLPLHPTPGLYSSPRISPDGKRVAFSSSDGRGHDDIWVRDVDRDTSARLTVLAGQSGHPVWTPDGRNVIFWSSNPTAPGMYSIRADGSSVAQRLTEGKVRQTPYSISQDGRRLAFHQLATTNGIEIWTAAIEGDDHPKLGTPEPFLRTAFSTISPAFSPDGRWLAYYCHEPEKEGVWVVPFPGPGGAWLISGRGDEPIWSRQGRQLFFTAGSHTIMSTNYTSQGDAFVFDKPEVWSPHPLLNVGTFDVTPDGKRVAVILNADGSADKKPITHLTFLLNFFDELRRRVK